MKLSDLILGDYKTLDDVKQGIESLEFCNKIDSKLYSNYYNNLIYFKTILKSILSDLEKHRDLLNEKDLLQIFMSICKRLEQVQYSALHFSDSSENHNSQSDDILDTEEFFKLLDNNSLRITVDNYLNELYNKYQIMDIKTQEEAKEYFLIKCDIIDFFDKLLTNKKPLLVV